MEFGMPAARPVERLTAPEGGGSVQTTMHPRRPHRTPSAVLAGLCLFACTTTNDALHSGEGDGGGGGSSALDADHAPPDRGSGGASAADAVADPGGPGDAGGSGGSGGSGGEPGDKPDAGRPGGDAGAVPDAAADVDATPGGPRIHFIVRTSTAAFPHADGLSGQTARNAYQGIRRFALLRGPDDPEPLVVLDTGDAPVEAGYNDRDETLIGSTPIAGLRPGRYTIGRNLVTHSRYTVNATMHVGALDVPGEFDNVQVLSEGTIIDGLPRPQSWFRYVFRAAGREFPLEGLGAPLPTNATAGGFGLTLEGGLAYYDYPIDLTIDPGVPRDVHVYLDVNMDHAFRWEDTELPRYAPSVFDATPVGAEPVRRFGANRLDVRIQ